MRWSKNFVSNVTGMFLLPRPSPNATIDQVNWTNNLNHHTERSKRARNHNDSLPLVFINRLEGSALLRPLYSGAEDNECKMIHVLVQSD